MLACNLTELGYKGDRFTYSNRSKEEKKFKARMDRGIVNEKWRNTYPNTKDKHICTTTYDHNVITIAGDPKRRGTCQMDFRFESTKN